MRVLKPEGVGEAQWAQHGGVPTGTIPQGKDHESLCSVPNRITRGEGSGEGDARNLFIDLEVEVSKKKEVFTDICRFPL